MLIRLLVLVLAVVPVAAPVEAGLWDSFAGYVWNSNNQAPPTIDTLIVHDQPGAMLEVKGEYQIYDPHAKEIISKRYLGKRKVYPNHVYRIEMGRGVSRSVSNSNHSKRY